MMQTCEISITSLQDRICLNVYPTGANIVSDCTDLEARYLILGSQLHLVSSYCFLHLYADKYLQEENKIEGAAGSSAQKQHVSYVH